MIRWLFNTVLCCLCIAFFTLVNFFSLFLLRGRRWSNCYLNRPSIKQLYVTTWERSTLGEMVTLRKLRWEGCPLLCLKENALVCLVPMVLGRLLLSIWLVKFDLSAINVFGNFLTFLSLSLPSSLNVNWIWKIYLVSQEESTILKVVWK